MKQMKDLLQLLLEDKRVKLFVAIVLVVLGGSISFFLYTYNRSFLKHRERLTDIQEFNNRLPVYCSKINVGHDGTTMEFSTLPGNEGPAGTSPLDSGSLSAASPLDQFAIHPLLDMKVPVIVICLLELRGLSVETFTNNRRFLMVFSLFTAALSTPPDIWCQIVACFLISLIIELTIFVALIVQVREEGWTSGMRESGSIDKKEE